MGTGRGNRSVGSERGTMTPVVTDSTRDAVEGVGEIRDVVLLLVDLDDRLAVLVQGDADPGDARLVEHLLGVLLLRCDRLVEAGGEPPGGP